MTISHLHTSQLATCIALAAGLALAVGCSDSTASDGDGETASTEGDDDDGSSSSSEDGESGTDDDETDSGTTSVSDPECANTWETIEQKDNGQTHAAYGIAVADDGMIAAVGTIENTTRDAWVAVYDADGNKQWEEVIDSGEGSDAGYNVTFDGNGNIVFIGNLVDANSNATLWFESRSVANGAVNWTVDEPSQFDGDQSPSDIDLAPDGTIVLSAGYRLGDQDSDVWVSKRSASDGAEIWSSTFTGQADGNGWSIDTGGPLAVSSDGTIFVGGVQGVDFETREAVLLAFSADGAEQWDIRPKQDGNAHSHFVQAMTAGPDGEAYAVIYDDGATPGFWLMRLAGDGSIGWELTEEDFTFAPTTGWTVADLDIGTDGQLTVAGRMTNEEVGQGIDWTESWVANLELDGTGTCLSAHTWQNTHIIPANTRAYGMAEGPNGAILGGEVIDGPENRLWIGGYN